MIYNVVRFGFFVLKGIFSGYCCYELIECLSISNLAYFLIIIVKANVDVLSFIYLRLYVVSLSTTIYVLTKGIGEVDVRVLQKAVIVDL